MGSYPTTKGDILVTDQYFSWQADKSWTGHAGIVLSFDTTTEAFPDTAPTVDTHRNNWDTRFTYCTANISIEHFVEKSERNYYN